MWPDEPFQCIVSVGTGKYKGRSGPSAVEFSSLREKLLKIVASATDTEGEFLKNRKERSFKKLLSFFPLSSVTDHTKWYKGLWVEAVGNKTVIQT